MTEVEKLDAGLEYDFWDDGVDARKQGAEKLCRKLNALPMDAFEERRAVIAALLGSAGEHAEILTGFHCDSGKNIHVGKNFLANYNVTILDIAPVYIGDYVMIAPNVCIITVNHPMRPSGRRAHLGIAKPVKIGNDVWIGAGAIILPGVTIGNNVVVASGAVVTKDVGNNCVVGGVPARVIKQIESDVD